jgi:hypothetical protein
MSLCLVCGVAFDEQLLDRPALPLDPLFRVDDAFASAFNSFTGILDIAPSWAARSRERRAHFLDPRSSNS